jgi:hypothetical protein
VGCNCLCKFGIDATLAIRITQDRGVAAIQKRTKFLSASSQKAAFTKGVTMKNHYTKSAAALCLGLAVLLGTSCSMINHPNQTAGSYIDDVTISNSIRARYIENKMVSAYAIKVETLGGVVQLSGFASSRDERNVAERLANEVGGVKEVHNDIIVK